MLHFQTDGFPKRVSDYIELPRIEELILMPFVNGIDADKLYNIGTDFQRYLIDKTPITNKKKYVNIQSSVRLLTPSVSPVINDFANDLEWHVDGNDNFVKDDIVMHIVCNKTSSMTEFNTTPFQSEYKDAYDLIANCNDKNSDTYPRLEGREIEPSRIYTFNNTNIHRAKRVVSPEFRFFFRVVETDVDAEEEDNFGATFVYNGSRMSITNIIQEFKDGKVDKITFIRN